MIIYTKVIFKRRNRDISIGIFLSVIVFCFESKHIMIV